MVHEAATALPRARRTLSLRVRISPTHLPLGCRTRVVVASWSSARRLPRAIISIGYVVSELAGARSGTAWRVVCAGAAGGPRWRCDLSPATHGVLLAGRALPGTHRLFAAGFVPTWCLLRLRRAVLCRLTGALPPCWCLPLWCLPVSARAACPWRALLSVRVVLCSGVCSYVCVACAAACASRVQSRVRR